LSALGLRPQLGGLWFSQYGEAREIADALRRLAASDETYRMTSYDHMLLVGWRIPHEDGYAPERAAQSERDQRMRDTIEALIGRAMRAIEEEQGFSGER
jgi:hypothetical protein